MVRETITGELAPGRAARLHAAVAGALEQLDPVPVAAVADHLWQASEVVAPVRAAQYLRLAAEESLAVLAHEQGEQHLRRALHLLTHDPSAGADEELAVRLRLTQVLTGLKGWTAVEIEEVSGRVRELAKSAGISPELVPLWWSLWTMTMTRCDLDTSLSLATQLLAAAQRHGDARSLLAGKRRDRLHAAVPGREPGGDP